MLRTIEVVPYHDSGYPHLFERRFLEDGMTILKDAKVPETLQKVAEDLRPDYPDVHIEDKPFATYTHGVVGISMTWNSQEELIRGVRKESYNRITLAARLATKEVVVSTRDGWLVLAETDYWRTTDNLKLIIEEGIKNPLRWGKVLGEVR